MSPAWGMPPPAAVRPLMRTALPSSSPRLAAVGGKVESGEIPQYALQRELHEELGVEVRRAALLRAAPRCACCAAPPCLLHRGSAATPELSLGPALLPRCPAGGGALAAGAHVCEPPLLVLGPQLPGPPLWCVRCHGSTAAAPCTAPTAVQRSGRRSGRPPLPARPRLAPLPRPSSPPAVAEEWRNEPRGMEGQSLVWVECEDLMGYADK